MQWVSFSRLLFVVGVVLACTGLMGPPLALTSGILFGMLFLHPFAKESQRGAKLLLQVSVVALGFGINFGEVVKAGSASVVYTAVGIGMAMMLGLTLGKVFAVRPKASFLIAAGTAICGGSAIAALAPITNPDEDELAMSIGTVFTLNSIALFVFPVIGVALHLTQTEFGLWCALAIHDTSSVVGAAAKFGAHALAVGTVVKLTRALWIVPVALLTALLSKSQTRVQFPWFIPLFCLAAIAKSSLVSFAPLFSEFNKAGHIGLALTLFLIGTGISLQTVRKAGIRVMAQGAALWVIAATVSLWAIHSGWIAL